PPIIQLSAYYTPTRDFRRYWNSIGMLAVGLVLASMLAVAVVAHQIIPGMPWAAAFALGAIVAPPDAVAASSIARRLRLPRNIVTVLEGESLLNDATALVAYRTAVMATVTGIFSFWEAGGQFLLASLGGVVVGLVVCVVIVPVFRRLTTHIPVYLALTFISGFGAYLIADTLHVSGVLAVITLGILYNQPRFNTMTSELRIQGTAVWEIVVFLLNGLIFILIGLQLRSVVERLPGESLAPALGYAALICLTLIVVRLAWMYPGAYISWRFSRRHLQMPPPPWQQVTIVGWTGMRGIVSLASALALPLAIGGGAQFPQRDLIVFLTFCVILVTLVLQGLSLPLLIRWLRVEDDGSGEREKHKARMKVALTAQHRLHELVETGQIPVEFAQKLKHHYASRVRLHSARHEGREDKAQEELTAQFAQLQQDLITVELEALIRLRNQGVINDEVLREVQRDLDFEWLRLQGG
ncbi:MAG: Na+/H+ antiporter, partial [Ktedonobacteraceae bacterium]|nr:Na+/H+ antiporter [Ktedonobacteraceae bacterium]